jgi:hypothetical protein
MTDPATDTWAKQLEQLKARYKHARPPILVALNILLHNADVSAEDAKAQAALHGARITAASISAAQRLLSRMDAPPAATAPNAAQPAAAATATPTRASRRPRAADAPIDAESLIKNVVARIQGQGNVEAERLRNGIRKAIAALQATLGS